MNKDTQLFTCSASHKEETERLFKQCIARNEEILQPKNRLDNESLENCIKNGMYKCPETNIVVALSHSPELPLVLRKL